MKYSFSILVFVMIVTLVSPQVYADGPTMTASLNINSSASQALPANGQLIELARINVVITGTVHLGSIKMGTDVSNGLQNFAELKLYDVTGTSTYVADLPSPGTQSDTFSFQSRTISDQTKVYAIQGSLNSSAQGTVRVGFKNLTFDSSEMVTQYGLPVYSNPMTLPGSTPTPTPNPTPTPTPSITATPTPAPTATPTNRPTPASRGFTNLGALSLTEGDTVSAKGSADPDIYIANQYGYKRLFLNPVIFSFYGHLGGFAKVKTITSSSRDTLVTSGLFRNCETNDEKVYGLESTGEDTGTLHWINTSGNQAVADDPNFFSKVFCINTNEFNWYQKGSSYTSVNQVPSYSR